MSESLHRKARQGRARHGGRSYHQEDRETRERRKGHLEAVVASAPGRARHFAADDGRQEAGFLGAFWYSYVLQHS